jgi:ABC-type dipeptide/oligopeptide/nickel transport system ATPase component
MVRQNRSQSLVINGESGAGKTETTKKAMQFLAALAGSQSRDHETPVEKQVLEVRERGCYCLGGWVGGVRNTSLEGEDGEGARSCWVSLGVGVAAGVDVCQGMAVLMLTQQWEQSTYASREVV